MHSSPTPRLSTLDRLLPLFILIAMALGIGGGALLPSARSALTALTIGDISLPIAIGLLIMMYPPLAKVRYEKVRHLARDRRLMFLSLALNWLAGPLLMFTLAWVFLPNQPELRTGLIIVGLARCIAMVLVWSDLSCADREATAILVAINSLFQLLMFSALGWFYLHTLPSWLGLDTTTAHFSFTAIARSVLIFLGIPLLAGALSRTLGSKLKSPTWYDNRFLPAISPLATLGLLFTIVILFFLQGDHVLANPLSVTRVALPMTLYFLIMYTTALLAARAAGMTYARATSTAFTAAGNNFELAIAVTIATYGANSPQALAGTVGPLIEIPILITLVYATRALGPRLFPHDPTLPTP